ncbi:polymer-forming cytoskeletal protein [Streptomyces griseocarneus]|uniref:polymer-forming cytoskeletal protein n=1 Tax=Streptomyces griseocarneus TaxID=51201 RepID=UPI00167CE487|nr:polymer-forming cytoskeletal protein [Streptomyces griseocarneus]MBZ6477357.1 polymer-forming cytoskeletal protein [Streptomyces griseocarneus]
MHDARRRARRLVTVAAAALLPTVALPVTPARAATACTVNGVPARGPFVAGTERGDLIVCDAVDGGTVVDARGGDDTVILDGVVRGRVRAGSGDDRVTLGPAGVVEPGASVDAQRDDDTVDIAGVVRGDIDGGAQNDALTLRATARVEVSGAVLGAAGNDLLRAEPGPHPYAGRADGGPGADLVDLRTTLAPTARALGGNDFLHAHVAFALTDGGPGFDICRVDAGNRPAACEL